MNNNRNLRWAALVAVGLPLALTSCQDELGDDPHYKVPSFLKGNAYEVLQKEGNYTTFLRGIDLIGYSDVVDSQILTVLAPNDAAFAEFLAEKGYASIDEMYKANPKYVEQVITYHLLYYAMDWDKMTNFRPQEGDGATDDQREVMAGMYNRFRTRCLDPDTREFNPDPAVNDTVTVAHYERLIPVFSQKMWNTLGLTGREAYNYNYFYPGTPWNRHGIANSFTVANAAVTDTEAVVTDNGYLYHVDHVVEPLKTIYEELRTRPDYSIFFRLCDSYSYYLLNETETNNRGYEVYSHEMSDIPNIAREWYLNDYHQMVSNMMYCYNMFAPTDAAMTRMFNEFWEEGCGYGDVSQLNSLILSYFIYQSFTQNSRFCWPDFLEGGQAAEEWKALTQYDTPINIVPETVTDRIMCCNGVIYGANSMDVPLIFSSVAGPAFKDVRYLPYLYVLDNSGQILTLSSQQSDFITLIPDTAQFTHNEPAMRLYRGSEGDVLQVWNDEEANFVNPSKTFLQDIVNMNTTTNATELKTDGTQVIETNASFNYWYVKDGKITTNQLFNQQLNPSFNDEIWFPFKEIERGGGKTWDNGRAYSYEAPGIFTSADAQSLENQLSTNNDRNYPFYCFSQLLRSAGLAADGFFAGRLMLDPSSPRFVAFVPTNEALKEHIAELPGCSKCSFDDNFKLSGTPTKATLAAYLASYFVTADRNTFTAYPFLGSPFANHDYDTGGNYGIRVSEAGNALSVTFVQKEGERAETPTGNTVPVVGTYSYLPFAFSDGCFQLIDGVLF